MDLHFDPLQYRYPSRRRLVYGRRGMVCASQPLAAQAGLDMIKKGGNAFDAALAAAACLAVVEPMSCNMGGDGFALIWHEGKLYGLNASGPAPALLSVDTLKQAGYTEMPKYGWGAVTVPGVTSRLGGDQQTLWKAVPLPDPGACRLLCPGRLPCISRGIRTLEPSGRVL